ncbi:hypothetical protein PCC7418_1537 [Halothece sp. PCC 7418]|uniref:anti-sigma factor family protein n=1 Tax=Halothece sp. (strain PCC 7418) TaxID=65093 RepID=UPI0002A06DCE|nr:zf-HC2 domain-containing protein [Halothece sp. PCC 7418]AFZ43725.1 hypothetical protein PCC7418_1537 [Halothece sp. PCC 7418]
MDNQQRFELLSAYLDQELSPEETKKVEQWLKEDEEARQTYQRLLNLRYRLREMPVPSSQLSPEVLTEKVTTQARNQTLRQVVVWGGGTIAALFAAIMTGVFSASDVPIPRFARSNEAQISSNGLMIALDRPIMEIPEDRSSSEAEGSSSTSPTSR